MTMDTKCDCGGVMKPARLTDVDLSGDLGIKVTADVAWGYRCDRCGWETLSGEALNRAIDVVVAMILGFEERLPSAYARYLRKYVGLTQLELSRRMGITRKTVNQWETGDPISPQHDLILRALAYAHLSEAGRPEVSVIDHVRTAPPKARTPRLVVRELGKAA